MGCDGGTIPKRHELVKGPKKIEKVCWSLFPLRLYRFRLIQDVGVLIANVC